MYAITMTRYGRDEKVIGFYTTKVKAIKALRNFIKGKNRFIFYTDIICDKSTNWTKQEDYHCFYACDLTMTEIYKTMLMGVKSGAGESWGSDKYTIAEVIPDIVEI